jgi:hypothetical protein
MVLFVISAMMTQGAGYVSARALSLFDSHGAAAVSFLRQDKGVMTGPDLDGATLVLQRIVEPLFGLDIPGRPLLQMTSVPFVMRPCIVENFEDNPIIQGELCA